MPIPRKQFDKGLDESRQQILKFLTEHHDQAFEVNEVADAIYGWGAPPDIGTAFLQGLATAFGVGTALDDLARQGLADKKVIGGQTYYGIHRG